MFYHNERKSSRSVGKLSLRKSVHFDLDFERDATSDMLHCSSDQLMCGNVFSTVILTPQVITGVAISIIDIGKYLVSELIQHSIFYFWYINMYKSMTFISYINMLVPYHGWIFGKCTSESESNVASKANINNADWSKDLLTSHFRSSNWHLQGLWT